VHWQETKKGLRKDRPFSYMQLTSTCAVRRAIEGNPWLSSGWSLLASESPAGQACPVRQGLISLSTGIGSFKYTPLIRTLQGSARNLHIANPRRSVKEISPTYYSDDARHPGQSSSLLSALDVRSL